MSIILLISYQIFPTYFMEFQIAGISCLLCNDRFPLINFQHWFKNNHSFVSIYLDMQAAASGICFKCERTGRNTNTLTYVELNSEISELKLHICVSCFPSKESEISTRLEFQSQLMTKVSNLQKTGCLGWWVGCEVTWELDKYLSRQTPQIITEQ